MAQHLLAYITGDYSDEDVEALRNLIDRLTAQGDWCRRPPELVDQFEEDSRTKPEDEAVRTVGLLLAVGKPGELPPTPVAEPTRIVDALAKFSEQRGVGFELQLDDIYVGEIQGGVPDRLIRDGLLACW
jgi:hypothetical protein